MAELNRVTGTGLPLIQAPMAGSQGAALAEAVFRAGALGSLPAAMLSPQALSEELRRLQAAANRPGLLPFNINFFCHRSPSPDAARMQVWRAALAPYAAEWGLDLATAPAGASRQPFDAAMAEVLEIYRPATVSFHFGLPEPALLARVKAWGAQVLSSATTVEEARWLEAHGVDVVIAQGLEAGGHRGMFLTEDLDTQSGTMALLPQVVRAVQVPVVAAGGIADAAGVRAALALGASAVQVGTAFLGCPEATTSAVHRQALMAARGQPWGQASGRDSEQAYGQPGGQLARPSGEGAPAQTREKAQVEAPEQVLVQSVHTALTNLFSGRPARGLVNRLMRELGPMSSAAPAFPLASGALQPIRQKAEAAGSGDFSPLWCGQHPPRWMNRPAGDIVALLMNAHN